MRMFVTFRPTSSLKDKIMIFQDMDKHQVQNYLVANYGKAWFQIHTEQEFAQVLPQEYCMCETKLVPMGTECTIIVNNKVYSYPSNTFKELEKDKENSPIFKECD